MHDDTPRQPPLGSDGPIHVPRVSNRFMRWLLDRGLAREIHPPTSIANDELDRAIDTDKPVWCGKKDGTPR